MTELINYLLSGDDSSIVVENADLNGDGVISINDVSKLIDILLSGNFVINAINVVVNGAEGLTFGGFGTGPAR